MNPIIRTAHRWLSVAFTLAVAANLVAMVTMEPGSDTVWIGLMALVPLIPLLFTGIYLFVLPHLPRSAPPRADLDARRPTPRA